MRRCRVLLSGVRRVLLARARPSSAVRSVTPLASHGLLLASLRGRSFRRWLHSASLSIGQHSPARAHRGPWRTKKPRAHEVRRPDAQARDRAVAPRSPRGAGQQPAGLPKGQRRPPYRAHWPVSGRYLPLPGLLCPDPVKRTGRGRNTMRSPGEVGALIRRSAHRAK